MDFAFTQEQERFRKEVRDFLEEELRQGSFAPGVELWEDGWSPDFSSKLAAKGWIGLAWPREYGGQGYGYEDYLIYCEEVLRYGAPVAAHWLGERQIGPALVHFGSEEQKKEFLPRLLRAEISFCLGFSEPNVGSDLASVETNAVEDGDDFVINGQKTWVGWAHRADYTWLLARTDPDVPKHRGLSQFMVDLKLPGISIQPIIGMTGNHRLNEVSFDNVRVPKRFLVGEKNGAWHQMASQLDFERHNLDRLMINYPLFTYIVRYAKETGLARQPGIRAKLAQLAVEFEVGRLFCYRVACALDRGIIPNYEASMSKLYGSEFEQRLANTAMQILGPYGQLMPGSKWAANQGKAAVTYLASTGYTMAGGTSEILKNVIATRGLGLPRT